MFGAKPKPIEQTTTGDIWVTAFAGTLIIGGMIVASFFSKQSDGFLWVYRGVCAVMLVDWWRRSCLRWRHLAEYRRQKREPKVEYTKMNPLAKLPPIRK